MQLKSPTPNLLDLDMCITWSSRSCRSKSSMVRLASSRSFLYFSISVWSALYLTSVSSLDFSISSRAFISLRSISLFFALCLSLSRFCSLICWTSRVSGVLLCMYIKWFPEHRSYILTAVFGSKVFPSKGFEPLSFNRTLNFSPEIGHGSFHFFCVTTLLTLKKVVLWCAK